MVKKVTVPSFTETLDVFRSSLRRAVSNPGISGYHPLPVQKLFHASNARGKLLLGGNRCLDGDTLVLGLDGSEIPIRDIEVGDYVLSLNKKTGYCKPAEVLEIHNNGLQECFRYKVGRYKDKFDIISTESHKFYGSYMSHGIRYKTVDSWSRFNTKDSKLHRSNGTNYGGVYERRALLLGLMLGDGHFANSPSQLQFTCADKSLIDSNDYFHNAINSRFKSHEIQYKLYNVKEHFEWFKELGLIGTRSSTKFIPEIVWSWSEKSISDLLAGLIATDGSIWHNNGEWHLNYCSNSLQMITEFRRLAGLRLGIWGSTITNNRGNYEISYGTCKAFELFGEINIPGKKKYKIEEAEFSKIGSDSSQVRLISKERVGLRETFDLTIDSDSHIYMLANGLLTHNSGKTQGGAAEVVMKMCGLHPNQKKSPPVAWRAIGSSFEDGIKKIIMPAVIKWLPKTQLKNGSWDDSYDLSSRTLTLVNGSTLEFLTYDQLVQKHAGTSRDGVWFDEEPPEDIFNENMLRLVDVAGEWILTMTPLIDFSWTFKRLYQAALTGENKNIEVFHSDTLDNIYVDPTELEILLTGMTDEEKDARKHGTYYSLSGGIYADSLTQENFIEPIIDSDLWPIYYHKWGHFGMLDHGFTNLTAFHLGAFDEEGRIVIYEEYTASKRLVKENCENILAIIKKHGLQNKLEYTCIDPSTNQTDPITGSSVFNEYFENGLICTPANNDVKAGILRVSAKLKDNSLLITKNCQNLIKELPMYRWAKFASSKIAARSNMQEVPVKKDDHSCDAVRYGIMSRPQLFTEIEQPVGNVLGAPVMINSEHRIDEILMKPYNQFDNKFFDEHLGEDW